jgi:DNA-binding transcriptional regulator YdaS (Cro superfamily)
MDSGLKDLRRLKDKVGGRNKLAKLLGVTGPYVGRVLSGEKPMTEGIISKLSRLTAEIGGAQE